MKTKSQRRALDALFRTSFPAFCERAFMELNPNEALTPNWTLAAVCLRIQKMVEGKTDRRLVLNMPPRSLKSLITSVFLPAWLLGRDPTSRIICASYSEELAYKFSRDCRALMESSFYKQLFPHTLLNPKKITEREFETTKRGYRLATSVGGTLTGRGGDILIVDDPIKANDANSAVALSGAKDWFQNTALSRLDRIDRRMIIVVMQRLHADDLSGVLIEQGWPKLVLPMIATEDKAYPIGDDEIYERKVGELLQSNRDNLDSVLALKHEMGSRLFSAQYQQNPTPPDGNMIKAAWLGRYKSNLVIKYDRVVLCCDPAGKSGMRNDYTAIAVLGIRDRYVGVLHVVRGHWTILQMKSHVERLSNEWNVNLVIIEDTSSGMGLIQILREQTQLNVVGRHPKDNKETRMARHEGVFESGRILLPEDAPWLADFERELLSFPSGRYDDQVDSILLFLDWYAERRNREVSIPSCISIPNTDYPPGFMSSGPVRRYDSFF